MFFEFDLWGREELSDSGGAGGVESSDVGSTGEVETGVGPLMRAEREARCELDDCPDRDAPLALGNPACSAADDGLEFMGLLDEAFFLREAASGWVTIARGATAGVD